MRQLLDQVGELWCTTMHSNLMWPFRGRYQCGICHREYPVSFEAAEPAPARQERFTGSVVLRRA